MAIELLFTSSVLFTLITFLCMFILNVLPKKGGHKHQHPPGPWGFPLVGHIPMLGENPNKKFREWKKRYGPIFSIRMGTTPTVVIGDVKILKESFFVETLCGRPKYRMFDETIRRRGILLNDGESRAEQRSFTVKSLKSFGMGLNGMETRMLEDLSVLWNQVTLNLEKPVQVKHFFKIAVINSLWDLLMGARFDETDPTIAAVYNLVTSSISVRSSIDKLSLFAPWFGKWFSFLGYNRSAAEFRTFYKAMDDLAIKFKKSRVSGGPNCFLGDYLDKVDQTTNINSSFHHSHMAHSITTGDLLFAASATMLDAFDWLLLHLVRNPNVQQELQKEIDLIVGDSRTPTLKDRMNMPYAVAVGNEVLRKSGATGLSRRATENTLFQGYMIPKDTIIMKVPDLYDNDDQVWAEPYKFDPSRFLDESGKLKKTPLFPFAAGKSACIGKSYTLDYLFLIIAGFFQKFTVSAHGQIPSDETEYGLTNSTMPFQMVISLREREAKG